jgi:Domain of unknown function (DUF4184)
MPFTFSHPAIVLPVTYLPKKWYSLTGLIVGSMTPDFEYFIRMKDYSKYSHTWDGLFWFDLPLGLILIFIFHNVVRDILIGYLPFSLNIRFSKFSKFNWNKYFQQNIIVVLISLIVGIASHIFWDSFTHRNAYFFKSIPFLEERVNILNHQVYGAAILQYASSIIGGLVMLIVVFKLPEGQNTKQDNILNFWLLVSLVMISVVNVRLYLDTLLNHHTHEDIIVTIISGALIGITVLSFLLKESNKRRSQLYKRLDKMRNN